jgi:4-hydroxythreonine-4-phosphate dehydrogenase
MIAITLGDITGIGPEVTLKALTAVAAQDDERYLLIGDLNCLQQCNEKFGTGLPLTEYRPESVANRFNIVNPFTQPLPCGLTSGSPAAAQAAVTWLEDAAKRCLRQEVKAMVTAPVNKEAIIRAGIPFIGQTEFLTHLSGTNRTAMMLLGADDRNRWLRVALATTHLPIKNLHTELTQSKVELAIELAAEACHDLGLTRAKVAVCGLNPHAGEGGEFGDEEIVTIRPAVEAVRRRGIDAEGPFAADTIFYYVFKGDYDAVVAMYHDQGLVALKMVAFENGINWTLGLPFIRTSPDHGTAYNIAGKGIANPSSMIAALRLAKQLARKSS